MLLMHMMVAELNANFFSSKNILITCLIDHFFLNQY